MKRLAAAAIVAASSLACGHRAEKMLLDDFFAAARLHDTTALKPIATVSFAPNDQGVVRRFTIVRVTPTETSGGVESKSVTLAADVELPDGRVVAKTLVATLQHAAPSPWKITGITVSSADPLPRPH